jgi:CHAD domain-containing protein
MRAFALAKTAELLSTMISALEAAAADPHADAVHDMRVSIRRLQQGVRLFRQFLPRRGVKRLRKTMKSVMEPAGELRNYDIALELAGPGNPVAASLSEKRAAAAQTLASVVASLAEPGLADRWQAALKLGQQ